jgi:chemotaxis protein methyltransferase CheR
MLPRHTREFAFTWADFTALRKLVETHAGIAVADAKFEMFYARLARRLRALGLTDFKDYLERLRADDGQELVELINAITTNLTGFFREPHHFDFLAKHLIPIWAARPGVPLRIWSAGCSTGQEPYTIALVLLESLPDAGTRDLRVLATDLDTQALAAAAAAVYPTAGMGRLAQWPWRRWVLRGQGTQEGHIRLRPEVRALVHLRRLNLIGDWPLQHRYDAIFCRNVMIYFDAATKRTLVDRLADRLTEQGHLFLGHAESLIGTTKRLRPVARTVYALAEEPASSRFPPR